MLRRCVRDLSSVRSLRRRSRPIDVQAPFFLYSRSEFSSTSHKNSSQQPAGPAEDNSGSGKSFSKVILGSALVGAAAVSAYQNGYIDLPLKNVKSPNASGNVVVVQTSKEPEHVSNQATLPSVEKPSVSNPNMDVKTTENNHHQELETSNETSSEIKPSEDTVPSTENELSSFPESTASTPDEQTIDSEISTKDDVDNSTSPGLEENSALTTSESGNQGTESSIPSSEESDTKEDTLHQEATSEVPTDSLETETVAHKSSLETETEAQKSLADSYSLHADEEISGKKESIDALAALFNNKEVSVTKSGSPEDNAKLDDEKLVIDWIEVIHAAERRQAEIDAHKFTEEKLKLKDYYEKALKDARARQLMYAEEAAILEKELNKEKAKAAAAIKSLQEQAEQKLKEELKRKEEEADIQLTKAQELAKAELAAAVAQEKSSQIEKIAEANLNINALCMAFYARSEEARQTHSVHKLALGTLALEDALSRGLPIRAEVDKLYTSLEGIDRDSLLDLALSSLPEEALNCGVNTHMQLNQKAI
ncbi:MICOS complex subunit MIC60 isoform X1 [Iris pallida]|uniref:MICOS complex subunit MIC60 isoform X1 n=1 Tax=Iris pallida TaxID=29817 RepID=A0AAX6DJ61_IRIPA|nr:MICOS complex subunit MIC60 isoform X1 [Iris pallida]